MYVYRHVGTGVRKRDKRAFTTPSISTDHHRIKKLCATATAHTAAHAKNPSGYPDGSFCVLADQSCQSHISMRSTTAKRKRRPYPAPENRPKTTPKTDNTLCSAIGKANRCWRGHCWREKEKGDLVSAHREAGVQEKNNVL